MKKSRILMCIVAILLGVLVCGVAVSTTTTETEAAKYKVIKVKKKDIKKLGANEAIQAALDKAAKKGKASKPCKVIVPKGTYKLTASLHVYSNTYLYLVGVKFKQTKNYSVIMVGDKSDNYLGYKYKNITIKGGTFNGNNYASTVVKACHVKNFKMIDCTVKNAKNGHLMEIAGVKNVTIENCTFKNQIITKKSSADLRYEAIQIDILQTTHMSGYRKQDLANKNITITGCTFSNVPRGVGSHTTVLNNPANGITITNNTFTNCGSAAIHGMNWINCTITGNTITGSPRGISLFSIRSEGVYLSTTLSKQGNTTSKTSTEYIAPSTDQNIVISNNNISITGTDPYAAYDEVAISLYGYIYTSATGPTDSKNGDKAPAGDYYISGVTIDSNTIVGSGTGVSLSNVRNVNITNNTMRLCSLDSVYYDGVYVENSSRVSYISGNYINAVEDGICISASDADFIQNNTILNCTENGVYVAAEARVSYIRNNSITTVGSCGIAVVTQGCLSNIVSNTISVCGENGILLDELNSDITIQGNTIDSCKETAVISVSPEDDKTVTITSNKIYTSDNYAVSAIGKFNLNMSGNTFVTSGLTYEISSKVTADIGENEITEQ